MLESGELFDENDLEDFDDFIKYYQIDDLADDSELDFEDQLLKNNFRILEDISIDDEE